MKYFILLIFNIYNFGNFIIKWSYNGSLPIYKNHKNIKKINHTPRV